MRGSRNLLTSRTASPPPWRQFLATPGKPFPYFPLPYYKYLPILDNPVLPVKPGRCLRTIDTSLVPSSPKALASSSATDEEVLVVAVIPPIVKHTSQAQDLSPNTKDAPEVPVYFRNLN